MKTTDMKNNDLKIILNNQNGIAIMMVMTSIVLLSAIMITFSFDTNVNKIKAYNIEDRGQARLTAEAGLQFAMARLRLYKEAFNYVQKNPSVKDFAKPEMINAIWNFPFVYPIPVTSQMNQIQKDAIQKFADETFLEGEMRLTINNISNQINLNMLRVALLDSAAQKNNNENNNDGDNEKDEDYGLDNQLMQALRFAIDRKVEKDDEFASRYIGASPVEMVNVIKYYVSDFGGLEDDGGARAMFDSINIRPKYAPLMSPSELYALPLWDDALVDLIKNEFTVYGAIMIDLNKITDKLLRLLIPTISEEEMKEFFEYKDNPDTPRFFNSIDDFKNYFVNVAHVVNAEEFSKRIKKFEANGIRFGPSPSLFRISSVGTKGRASYSITAYVVMPPKPFKASAVKPNNPNNPNTPNNPNNPNDLNDPDNPNPPANPNTTEQPKQITQLLEPRIVDIFIH
jgi:hypothetical protein